MPTIGGANIGLSLAAGVADRTAGLRLDPYQSCNFVVEIEGLLTGGFANCSGLLSEIEGYEYREGGVNDHVHHFAGRVHHPALVLKHGMSPIDGLWNWYQDTANGIVKRRNGTIFLLNQQRVPVMSWDFRQGLPLKWTGPDLDASKGAIAFESLEIAHHGLTRPRLTRVLDDAADKISATFNLPAALL